MKEKLLEEIEQMSSEQLESLYNYIYGEGSSKSLTIEEKFKTKFGVKATQELKDLCNKLELGFSLCVDFVKYRNEIKKPVKTTRPIKLYINELGLIKSKGFDVLAAIEVMKLKEWQSIKIDWIEKGFRTQANKNDLSKFGFKG